MSNRSVGIESVLSPEFAQNCFVVWRRGSSEAIIFDPGFNTEGILDVLSREELVPVAIVNTHGHADHIAGNQVLKQLFPSTPLMIGANEASFLSDPEKNLSALFGFAIVSPEAERLLVHGETVELAGLRFEVREIPGHSPGSLIFYCDQTDPPIILGGDVLFAGSVGRTDFGGSMKQLTEGIRTKLFTLPDHAVVYPGHGPETTIGVEKRTNPYVGAAASDVG